MIYRQHKFIRTWRPSDCGNFINSTTHARDADYKGRFYEKRFSDAHPAGGGFSATTHADDAAIKQSLAKLGVQSTDIQNAPVAGMKTVLTNSGVLYVTEDGKHIIQGPMYDVSGARPVNVTNQLLMTHLNALEKEMIIYKAPKEQHVITVFTDITCGYCHKLHEEMSDYNALGITVRYLAFPRQRASRARLSRI